MDTTPQRKTIQIKARITEVQHVDLICQAQHAGVTLSELIRQRVANKPLITRTDTETAKSIDRIGRMLKHYYPKDKGWADSEERRKWWRLAEDLRRIARDIQKGSKV